MGSQIAATLGEFGGRVVLVARKAAELEAAVAVLASEGTAADRIAAGLGTTDAAAAVVSEAIRR